MSNTTPPPKRKRTPAASQYEVLIPIRLDFSIDGRRVHESFTWNLRESSLSPRAFAGQLVADLGLPDSARDQVAEAMLEQITAFKPPPAPTNGECRHVVRLDLRVGRVLVRDQFEWDLHEPRNSPEAFAELLCADLGLNTEHVAAVAHAIREQLVELGEFRDKRQKCAVVTERDVLRGAGEVGAWEPAVECLTAEEQERLERKEKREARLLRRNRGKAETYGRGPTRRRASVTTSRRRSRI